MASSVAWIFSASAIVRSCPAIAAVPMVRNSYSCDLERMVSGIFCIRRRQDEDDVRRRLFDRLQQRVERRPGELVHLVDDEDL
jgi:hypothetical protein